MPPRRSAAPFVLLAAALGVAVGYALGDWGDTLRRTDPVDPPADTVAYIGSLQARIQQLERELGRRQDAPARQALGTAPATSTRPTKRIAPSPPDPAVAAEVLAQIRTALSDGDEATFERLAPAIAAQGALLAPQLTALLASADSLFAMEQLAELLGLTADPASVDALTSLLERESADAVRSAAIRSLGQIGDPRAIATLAAEFGRKGGSPMPPSLAATALGSIGSTEAVTALRSEITKGDNRMVRTFALRALAGLRQPELGGFFLAQANRADSSDRYQVEAITAAGEAKSRDQIAALEQILFAENRSRAVREAAKKAVNRILGQVRYPLR